MPTTVGMNSSSISSLLATSRELATSRWRQLAAAIGLTALLGAVLWFLLIQVTGSISDGPSGDSGMPSRGGIFLAITFAWAILVSAFVAPMAASTAAIADDGDDSALGWIRGAVRSLPWMWLRLAIPTLPLLLLGLWAINDLFSAFANLAASFEASASGTAPPEEPGEPLSFRLAELLFGSAPARWAVFATVLGLWFMWSATRATGQDERAFPHAPWRLFGRSPLIVAGLAGLSAVALGPLLSKSLSSLGGGIEAVAGAAEAGGDGGSTSAVLIVGMVISAFIGVVAIPWIALFREDDGFVIRSDHEATLAPTHGAEPGTDLGASATVATSEPVAEHPAVIAAAPTPQVIDQAHVAGAGAAAGSWWYLQAGSQAGIQVAAAPGVPVAPAASDASGAWLALHETGQAGSVAFVAPAAGWYLLGAWNSGGQDAQVAMRFTLPADAQPAPAQQAAG